MRWSGRLVDRLLDDPRKCELDPGTLLCSGADGPDWLTAAQVAALRKICAGPTTSSGERLHPGFLPGGEAPDPSLDGWDVRFVSGPENGASLQFILLDQFLPYLAFRLDRPDFTDEDFDFDRTPQQIEATGRVLDSRERSERVPQGGRKAAHVPGMERRLGRAQLPPRAPGRRLRPEA